MAKKFVQVFPKGVTENVLKIEWQHMLSLSSFKVSVYNFQVRNLFISEKIAFWDFTDVLFLYCACFLLTDFGVDIVWDFQACFACDLCVFIFHSRNMLNILLWNSVSDMKWIVTIHSLITLALPASDTDLFNQGSLDFQKRC